MGLSIKAQLNICSYCSAERSQLTSLAMPACITRSQTSLRLWKQSRAASTAPSIVGASGGVNVQPVPLGSPSACTLAVSSEGSLPLIPLSWAITAEQIDLQLDWPQKSPNERGGQHYLCQTCPFVQHAGEDRAPLFSCRLPHPSDIIFAKIPAHM